MGYKSAEDKRQACKRWRVNRPVSCLLKNARDRARLHSVIFNLHEDHIPMPLPTHCPVLGLELTYPGAGGGRRPGSASLDRLDNSRGYVPGNVAIMSWRANKLKSDATLQELRALVAYMERQR